MNPTLFSLLSDKGSLTERFKQMMGKSPDLTRLSQGRQFVSWKERLQLAIEPRQMALVREILMGDGHKNWMFARTIVPASTLTGSAKRISFLNERPIGQILFGRNGARRQSMTVELTWDIPQTLSELNFCPPHQLWQRQSIFTFASGPLMVTEWFLPDCPIYKN